MINMIQIMMDTFQMLLQSWRTVTHTVSLYKLMQYNVIPINPTHTESFHRVRQSITLYGWTISPFRIHTKI